MFKTKKELLKDKQANILTELRVLRWWTEQTPEAKRRIENLRLENLYLWEAIKEQESASEKSWYDLLVVR
jgi:hypothetical protein